MMDKRYIEDLRKERQLEGYFSQGVVNTYELILKDFEKCDKEYLALVVNIMDKDEEVKEHIKNLDDMGLDQNCKNVFNLMKDLITRMIKCKVFSIEQKKVCDRIIKEREYRADAFTTLIG